MSLSFEPRVLWGAPSDCEGLLVSFDKKLVALLIRLSHIHGELEGRWFIEWAFRDELTSREIFSDLESVSDWISKQMQKF